MPDIFDEISDDLRAERARSVARRLAIPAAVAALLLVLGVAGWQAWLWRMNERDGATAAVFTRALRDAAATNSPTAIAAAATALDQIAATGPEGYRTLARLRAGALRASAGDKSGAVALWNVVAADRDADPLLRDAAALQSARLMIDDGDPAALRAQLAPLRQADNPWHGLANEASALLDFRTGREDDARATLKALADDTTAAEAVRGRAAFLLRRLPS